MKRLPSFRVAAVCLTLCATSCTARANPGLGANISLRANVREDAHGGVFAVPVQLRERVDFWKEIFTKYGKAHSVIHHRDFPQIVFGVIDLSREYASMSPSSFDAYKQAVVARTVEDLRAQLLELSNGAPPRTPFQERMSEELRRRGLPVSSVQAWLEQDLIRTQTGIRERYVEAMQRAWRYLPVMEQIFVSEYGLPKELTRIPFIESSFDYSAYSSVGAAGIWQFMPKTARAHRMLVGRYVDERRDPLKATRAAAEYLRSAYSSLGSWPLAITSYNHGVGGVRAKVRKAGTEDLARIIEDPSERYFGFASSNFYPEFLAAVEIFDNHNVYFPDVPEQSPLRVASYSVRKSVSAPFVAKQLGVPIEALREANYGLLDSVWAGRASIPSGYTLRIPIDYKQQADNFFGAGTTEHITNVSFQKSDDSVRTIRTATLHEYPSIQAPQLQAEEVKQFSKSQKTAKARSIGGSITPRSATANRKQASVRTIVVRSGDTLGSLAKRHGTRVERIKQLNNMKSSKVTAGQKLLIPQ